MPTIEFRVIEKWTERPIPYVTIYIGGQEFKTDEEGKLSIGLTKGVAKIEAEKGGFERAVVSLMLVSDMVSTIKMTPVLEALV